MELPGIFNWAIEGLKRLQLNDFRFSYSKAIMNEEIKYKMSQQPVNYFFESMLELDEQAKVKRNELYDLYCQWHLENGLLEQTKRTRQKFYDELNLLIKGKYLNVVSVRIQGYVFLKGIKFKDT